MWLHTHAYMTDHICVEGCALSRAAEPTQYRRERAVLRVIRG